jgi:hypothetical protein
MSVPRKSRRVLIAGAATALIAASSPQSAFAEPVDVELILAVDVSLSMSPAELAIQRDGYIDALTHETVINAIKDGLHGRIAIAYVEWAGAHVQHIVVPWTLIADEEDARRVAEQLTLHPPNSARRTSITGMLHFASDMFAESEFTGMRRVVDVSGDGPNNQGGPVVEARDMLVEQGITINGLPLMTSGGYSSVYDITYLDRYYAECVVGGPASFMIPVNEWSQFAEAVRRKLVLELVDADPRDNPYWEDEGFPLIRAQAEPPVDCEVGEKRWSGRGWNWQRP